MSNPPAHTFRTITDADWQRELRAARERGAKEGEQMLTQLRANIRAAEAQTRNNLVGVRADQLKQRQAS